VRHLARALREQGHEIHFTSVPKLLRALDYSMQANRKNKEGASHPDRDAQFRHINATVKAALASGEPAISVDTKKKELVGDFKNAGQEWHPKGSPIEVRTHDFKDKLLGKVNPYGIFDIASNEGWVSVGITADTGAFAAASIRSWWQHLGSERYPDAKTLTITADCGGSNGNRTRLWKTELQKLADETGLQISVCHFPPGTSKWNKIEHRLFSFISRNWRGQPLVSRQAIVSLIGATTSSTGLKVYAQLDEGTYERGIKVSDANWPRSTSPATSSTANGTTSSHPRVVDLRFLKRNTSGRTSHVFRYFIGPGPPMKSAAETEQLRSLLAVSRRQRPSAMLDGLAPARRAPLTSTIRHPGPSHVLGRGPFVADGHGAP
jgi:hypothetical protein